MPALARWLRGLMPDAIDALEADPASAKGDAPSPFAELEETGRRLAMIPPLLGAFPLPRAVAAAGHAEVGELSIATAGPGAVAAYGIPERKWTQVRAFASVALSLLTPSPPPAIVDWCAGKGHLGRTLAFALQRPVHLVERNAALQEDALRLASHRGVAVYFHCVDALSPSAAEVIRPGYVAIALHACGVLTDLLLEAAIAQGASAILAAPCCYHNLAGSDVADAPTPMSQPLSALSHRRSPLAFTPRSRHGRALDLRLDAHLLRLPTADEIVARPALRRSRRRELAWRLGFDLLVREATGEDRYTPLGPVPKMLMRLPFRACAEALAKYAGHPLPAHWNAARAEEAGWERARLARALGLVRCLFRRPLEVWLVLDRALRLSEAGRTVAVGTFCDPSISPRNIVIASA